MAFLTPEDNAAARAISYAISSSTVHMSVEAHDALLRIATRLGVLRVAASGEHGSARLWRDIAALALQMEVRALGLDYTLPVSDKTLTPD